MRNNNPGNIEDGAFAKSQLGYMGSDGRFAKFDSVANGTSALDGLLTKNYGGLTVSQLINKYAPPGENNSTAYANTVAKRLGIDVNSVPDMSNADVRSALRQSIVSVEQGILYEKVADYLAGNTGQNPALVDATGKISATGGADATQLHPAFVNRVAALSAEAEKATGQKLSFNELHRTTAQQAEIRARHEAMPGGVAAHPAAPAGSSYHEFGAAGDMDNNKAATWARTPGPDGRTPIQRNGLEQLGGQTGKNDPLHIQLPKADWSKTAQAEPATPTKGPNAGKPPAGSYQVAGLNDVPLSPEGVEKQRKDLEAHRAAPDTRTPEQMNADSPAPPPGSAMPRNERALPTPEQAPPPPGDKTPISAIPPGPTVPAQDARFDAPPESGYPDSAQTLPVTHPPGPEDPEIAARQAHGQGTLPPARMYHSLRPDDMPSSGVGVSAADTYGPLQRTGAPPKSGHDAIVCSRSSSHGTAPTHRCAADRRSDTLGCG